MADNELFGISEQLNDTISRQAALDAVINLWADKPFGNPALVEIKDCIEALPSAQQWIPCSECKKRCEKWEQKGR